MTAAAIPAVLMATGATVSAGAAVYSGIQQKRAADYNAKMSEQNAKAIDWNISETNPIRPAEQAA